MIYKFMQQKHASFDDSPPEHPLTAEPCDRIGEARGVRWSSRSQRTYALIGELGAFSPGLKPSSCWIKRSRGFKNPLPRTKSPGLAQLETDHTVARPNYGAEGSAACLPGVEM